MLDYVDYRIANVSAGSEIRKDYQMFANERILACKANKFNEFEPKPKEIDAIEKIVGMQFNSLMVVFFPYMTKEKRFNKDSFNLSIHAVSHDYHKICMHYLEKICQNVINPSSKRYIQCDTGYFSERFFSIHTGLCKQGMNGLAIHPAYGSYGFLGLIATDEYLKEYRTKPLACMGCKLCVQNCPTNSILNDGMNSNTCFSYLTQKKELDDHEIQMLKKHDKVYGCDVCQSVCPENFVVKYSKIKDFNENLLYNIGLEEIKDMSNKEFKRRYRDRNYAWRGKKVLIRNLEMIDKGNGE